MPSTCYSKTSEYDKNREVLVMARSPVLSSFWPLASREAPRTPGFLAHRMGCGFSGWVPWSRGRQPWLGEKIVFGRDVLSLAMETEFPAPTTNTGVEREALPKPQIFRLFVFGKVIPAHRPKLQVLLLFVTCSFRSHTFIFTHKTI